MPGETPFETPQWEEFTEEQKFVPGGEPDERTFNEFSEDWTGHRTDKEMLAKIGTDEGKPNFQKLVETYPTNVPESFMTPEERANVLGAEPLTRHEIEELEKKRPN
jgi:hypothetical protein